MHDRQTKCNEMQLKPRVWAFAMTSLHIDASHNFSIQVRRYLLILFYVKFHIQK